MTSKRVAFLALALLLVTTSGSSFTRHTSPTSLVTKLKAATQPLTFTFTHVKELDCDEGLFVPCPNDFYPKVEIDGQGLDDGKERFCCAHDTEFDPNWVFTREVDTSRATINIHVELWDQDDSSGDDQIDIADGPKSLDIVVRLSECTWSAGALSGTVNTRGTSKGSGNDSAEITFVINSARCNDTDSDGLFDGWETLGYDADGNGTVDVDLPVMGANPNRKDLFLELDFLAVAGGHTHAPLQNAIRRVVQAFTNAPVGNVDGTSGIQLHVDVGPIYGVGTVVTVAGPGVTGTFGDYGGGNSISEAGNTIVDWDGATGNPATNFFTLKNLNANRNPIFRYGIFAHQTNFRAASNDCTSGWAKGIPGVNFIVSLGGTGPPAGSRPCWGVDAGGQSVGTELEQAGTLMHEFGHDLGLDHGGGDGINAKPNYLSVMNYAFQPCTVTTIGASVPGGCDYSRLLLPGPAGLNENSLDECQNIDNGTLGLGPLNWNGNGLIEGASNCQPPNNSNVSANINGDFVDTNGNGTQDPNEANIQTVLNGFQDWAAIVYNFRTGPNYTTAGTPTAQEADPQAIARARALLAQQLRPGLFIDKSGPADARPGDTLSYTLMVENTVQHGGKGPALNVVLVDTRPDGTSQTVSLGNMTLGTSTSRTLGFVVPCSTKDGAVLTNTAQATGQDLANNTVTTSDAVSTTIHAPIMVLALGATATVNAGEAITYTMTYQNTGSTPATNVTITDTIPTDVYYSPALDQCAGPRPASVTLNANGTRTLVWNIGGVPANSGPQPIIFTARPTLLALGGTTYTNTVSLAFQHGALCVADPVSASATSIISVVPLVKEHEPEGWFHWKLHLSDATAENLARIQATDQRFDGRDGTPADGALSVPEVRAIFKHNVLACLFARDHNKPKKLERELLALYFNLATRRLNADTPVRAKFHRIPGVTTMRDAALHVWAMLLLPYDRTTKRRYHEAIEALEEIND